MNIAVGDRVFLGMQDFDFASIQSNFPTFILCIPSSYGTAHGDAVRGSKRHRFNEWKIV